MSAQYKQLPGGRMHFQHGPIDIIIGADGANHAVAAAHAQAWGRFSGVLDELVQELALLRQPVAGKCPVRGPIARRMWQACQPYRSTYITPMAAVAGSVAQELIACYARPGINRAWINNGGDIALHLLPSESLRIGLYSDLAGFGVQDIQQTLQIDGQFEVSGALPVRGVATSGWRGRSFSLGIADSVTVLARSASEADAAATVIANAVNVQDGRIVRRPACEVKDDSDLGNIAVTVDVPPLEAELVQKALRAGLKRANDLRAAGLIWSAALVCQKQLATTAFAGIRMLDQKHADSGHTTELKMQVGSVFA